MSAIHPLVSVIIPTYNHGEFIEEAIGSVLAQTYRNLEVLVIDDGSTDQTFETLKRFQGRLRYVFQENQGVSSARNRGIRMAWGDFIAFLDSDDAWLPEKLELQMEILMQNPSVGLVGCGVLFVDSSGGVEKEWIPKDYAGQEEFLEELRVRNVFFNPSCAVLRRDCFDRVGLFKERLRFGEDWDMWLRVAKTDQTDFVRKPLVKFRRHAHSKSYKKVKIMKSDITEIIESHLEEKKGETRRKAYSYLYTDLSGVCQDENRRWLAAAYALKALWSYPLSLSSEDYRVPLLLKAMLPGRLYRTLKGLKESASRFRPAAHRKGKIL